ncbi:MAG: glycosyltransferase [Patescibacteria group bacterium]
MANKISVIIPYKKPSPYLRETLESLKKQTIYNDLEIILLEDVFGGVAACRNKGLERATGEYIYFLDSDDLLKNNQVLAKARKILENNKDLDFIYGDLWLADKNAKPLKHYITPLYHNEHLLNALKKGGTILLGTMLIKNNSDLKFNENIRVCSDIDYILKRTYQKKGKHVDLDFIIYRQHRGSIIHKKDEEKTTNIIRSIDIYKKFIKKNPEVFKSKNDKKTIIAKQSLIRAHMLLGLYNKKPAIKLFFTTLKYFPYCLNIKFFRVLLEFFIPKFIAKRVRGF